MSLFWSLKGKKNHGMAYWKTRSASIFINNIFQWCKINRYGYFTFLTRLLHVMVHEYLHLFLKFELGKWYSSEIRVIEPLTRKVLFELCENNHDFVHQFVSDFIDLTNELAI